MESNCLKTTTLKMTTQLGSVEVEESGWTSEKYPGYFLKLKSPKGTSLAEVLLEVDETDETPVVKIHVWDTTNEEPICDLRGCVDGEELALAME